MKHFVICLMFMSTVYAQDPGAAALDSSETGAANNWQNWVFAGSALLSATGAIIAVSVNNGEKVQSTTHN